MRVTARDLSSIPASNLRVGHEEFAELWCAAEAQADSSAVRRGTDWVAGGVAMTCRWLAGATVELNGRRRLPLSPITHRSRPAFEELIEAEYVAAVGMEAQPPEERLYGDRPGYVEAVAATLRWAWRRSGPVPDLRLVNAAPVPTAVRP
ncbi:hypothetical protein LWC33_07720 [Pseudonocardia sp. RS11V-5]|uniref:hypothetical protein n=1 Tax=Pseudonocardia terrae TaxID=2905831 RepID=UPI001E29C1FB|nr:hypothetical protein [Pseudonocardia terrae]MCE3551339.1 hypothetical protein [Pseudonocardia terrae]